MNYIIPNQLKRAIEQNKLIVFIGAGVSASAGLPLWKDIVCKTLENPDISKGLDFKVALEKEILTPLEVLDKIKYQNRKTVYKTFEEETFSEATNDIYIKLKEISKKFINTNYDQLLEKNTSIQKIDTTSAFNLQKIDEVDSFILKIHGCRTAIDNAVIFSSDYDDLYKSNRTLGGLANFQLTKLISSHSCLFLGYSLSDHFLTDLFNSLDEMYEGVGSEHYIISTSDINHKFVDTIKILSQEDITVILDQLINETSKKIKQDDNDVKIINENTKVNKSLYEEHHLTIGYDIPPIIENWAGRVAEMDALRYKNKACFITGIGGQGKSSLASKFLSEIDDGSYYFCEWRDFKEEDLNFQTKIYSLIEVV